MARSLNTEEAEIFTEAILATLKFPILADSAESLLKRHDEEMEMTPELGLWFGDHFPGAQEF